uniref:Uncharacterized protein n=1 Tax=Zea mays TaxID=4577 RepID=A0A804PQK2_MAIZE
MPAPPRPPPPPSPPPEDASPGPPHPAPAGSPGPPEEDASLGATERPRPSQESKSPLSRTGTPHSGTPQDHRSPTAAASGAACSHHVRGSYPCRV